MKRWQSLVMVLAVVAGGFFSGGCSLKGTAADLAEGALERGKEWIKNEVTAALPALEEKALAFAEKKLAEREAKDLASIDAQLALLGTVDPATGITASKIWRDFDADRDGHLTPGESLKLAAFVTVEGWKRVQAGTMTKETYLGMEKSVGVGLASLAVGGAGGMAVANRRRKRADAAAAAKPPSTPPPPPPA